MTKSPISLLLLDDSEDDRSFCISVLEDIENRSYLIEEVDTARKALNQIIKKDYDCILLDYNLPGHNGIWLVRELRIRNILTPVVMLTGGGSEMVAVEALKSGAQDYIPKLEVTSASLSAAIDQAIDSMRKELEMVRLVNYDSLTGLHNRHAFFSRLELALSKAERFDNAVGLLFLDLNKFKQINDTHGHATGDELLRQVGNRLKDCGRDYDTVARLGGDEFVFILERLDIHNSQQACQTIAERIAGRIAGNCFTIDQLQLNIEVSIGVCIYPTLCPDAGKLVELADQAMYQAKYDNHASIRFFANVDNDSASG